MFAILPSFINYEAKIYNLHETNEQNAYFYHYLADHSLAVLCEHTDFSSAKSDICERLPTLLNICEFRTFLV